MKKAKIASRKTSKSKPKRVLIYDEEGLTLLAGRIKELRKQKNFTQLSLATEAELPLSQIARIEVMATNPTVSTIFKISRALDCPVSELFDFKLSKKSNKHR